MLNESTIERRLITLEQTVANLQRKVESKPVIESWLQKLTGSISDEAVFLEALDAQNSLNIVAESLNSIKPDEITSVRFSRVSSKNHTQPIL